ncbi:MAG: hypothetical protein A2992_08660 [Elusimicrobia bacterium RIFCSPLOWO2_01_FULL_59_12]|nr:MAG: hypothetical protein A2992_08660 [Elusimicrobia bacterium RIFCSPLOWO2_01_FULL_59_12]
MAKRSNAKQEAKKLIEKLPDAASWDDIMYQFYVRQKYEHGIQAADRGEGMVHDQVKKLFRSK